MASKRTVGQGSEHRPVLEGLAAGGTITRPEIGLWLRLWLWAELILLFIAAPLAMRFAVHEAQVPLFVALLPIFALALVLLAADRTFRLRREFVTGFSGAQLLSILGAALIGAAAMGWWVLDAHPRWFLEFPRNRPQTYAAIMALYPFASVAAQELVYRTFYFHRYGPLFGRAAWLGIFLNAALFGFGHIVIGSAVAMIGTAVTGLLFALRYRATGSYWAVFVEHTLWGWLVFTIGLGRYFFTGVSNV